MSIQHLPAQPPPLNGNGYPNGGPVFQGSVVGQVDTIIQKAIAMKASDIHFEPYEAAFRLRYRLDGVLSGKWGNFP